MKIFTVYICKVNQCYFFLSCLRVLDPSTITGPVPALFPSFFSDGVFPCFAADSSSMLCLLALCRESLGRPHPVAGAAINLHETTRPRNSFWFKMRTAASPVTALVRFMYAVPLMRPLVSACGTSMAVMAGACSPSWWHIQSDTSLGRALCWIDCTTTWHG